MITEFPLALGQRQKEIGTTVHPKEEFVQDRLEHRRGGVGVEGGLWPGKGCGEPSLKNEKESKVTNGR